MFRILVVDDQKDEREGIRFLIETNNLPLEIAEAENGRNALRYIESNAIDILFTDIKMPFMDGLELAEKAKKINPKIKIVIFSAFGEFDYARKAIENHVLDYILKPIDISDFLRLMDRIIVLCEEEYNKKQRDDEILKGYLSDQQYQKNKMLSDIVNEGVTEEQLDRLGKNFGILFDGNIVLMLLNVSVKLFDAKNEEIELFFKSNFDIRFEYLNINERQSLVFLFGFCSVPERDYLERIGLKIREMILSNYGVYSYILFSKPIVRFEDLPEEYSLIEQMLEYRFYYRYGAVLFTDKTTQNASWDEIKDNLLSDICNSIDSKDLNYTLEMIEKLFVSFELNPRMSPVFVKYQCTKILRKIFENSDYANRSDFSQQIEKVFEISSNLMDLKELILDRAKKGLQINTNYLKSKLNRVVKEVVDIIDNEYKTDLSLEDIAKRVYMTPSYVSYLFKKEIGMTPIKYITQYRMDKARVLLLNTNMKIIDIAETLGYLNVSYFVLLFRNRFGISPAKLREESEAR